MYFNIAKNWNRRFLYHNCMTSKKYIFPVLFILLNPHYKIILLKNDFIPFVTKCVTYFVHLSHSYFFLNFSFTSGHCTVWTRLKSSVMQSFAACNSINFHFLLLEISKPEFVQVTPRTYLHWGENLAILPLVWTYPHLHCEWINRFNRRFNRFYLIQAAVFIHLHLWLNQLIRSYCKWCRVSSPFHSFNFLSCSLDTGRVSPVKQSLYKTYQSFMM